MLDGAEVLDDGAQGRSRRVLLLGGALAATVVAVGATARTALLPPPPLTVALAGVDGSALAGDSFVRLHLELRAEGASAVGDLRLTVAGSTHRGLHPGVFAGDGRMTVQVDVTPACPQVAAGVAPGSLDLVVRDREGARRSVRLPVPTSGRLERLVRYRCR